jgi:hypothetical protein
LSGAFAEILMPIMTIIVEKTSEAECIASEIIAIELPKIPATNLKIVKKRFASIVTIDVFNAIFSVLISCIKYSKIFYFFIIK